MPSDTFSDSCDDDSSFDPDPDSEGPMTSQCIAGAALESLVVLEDVPGFGIIRDSRA